MRKMRAIIFINFNKFGMELLELLCAKGITPVLLSSITPDQVPATINLEECIFQSTQDMCLGKFPESLSVRGGRPITPDPKLLEAMAGCERTVLPMMERLNYFNIRTIKLIQLYRKYVANWLGIFHSLKPDVIIFQGTPHEGFDFVVYSLAQVLNIKTLIPERTIFKDRFFMLENIHEFPPFPASYTADHEIDNELLADYQSQQKKVIKKEQATVLKTVKSMVSALTRIPRIADREFDTVFALCKKPPMKWQKWLLARLEEMKAAKLQRLYMQKSSLKPDMSVPYVYLPLNLQPERTTLPMGKDFWDYYYVLDMLLESIPQGWKIYVKEHPRQFSRSILKFSLARDRDFYEKLSSDNRVRFVALDLDSDELIHSAKCLVTVSGTAGWEAISKGTPCLIFGSPWYKECPGVFNARDTQSCSDFFDALEQGKITVDPDKVKNYAAWVKDKCSYIGSLSPAFITSLTKTENTRHLADAIDRALSR